MPAKSSRPTSSRKKRPRPKPKPKPKQENTANFNFVQPSPQTKRSRKEDQKIQNDGIEHWYKIAKEKSVVINPSKSSLNFVQLAAVIEKSKREIDEIVKKYCIEQIHDFIILPKLLNVTGDEYQEILTSSQNLRSNRRNNQTKLSSFLSLVSQQFNQYKEELDKLILEKDSLIQNLTTCFPSKSRNLGLDNNQQIKDDLQKRRTDLHKKLSKYYDKFPNLLDSLTKFYGWMSEVANFVQDTINAQNQGPDKIRKINYKDFNLHEILISGEYGKNAIDSDLLKIKSAQKLQQDILSITNFVEVLNEFNIPESTDFDLGDLLIKHEGLLYEMSDSIDDIISVVGDSHLREEIKKEIANEMEDIWQQADEYLEEKFKSQELVDNVLEINNISDPKKRRKTMLNIYCDYRRSLSQVGQVTGNVQESLEQDNIPMDQTQIDETNNPGHRRTDSELFFGEVESFLQFTDRKIENPTPAHSPFNSPSQYSNSFQSPLSTISENNVVISQEEYNSILEENEELRSNLAKSELEIKRLKEELANKDSEIKELNEEIECLDDRTAKLQGQINDYGRQNPTTSVKSPSKNVTTFSFSSAGNNI